MLFKNIFCGALSIFAIAVTASATFGQARIFNGSIYDLDPPANQSTDFEAIIGSDDIEPLASYPAQDFYRILTRPVGRLSITIGNGKSSYCTAALIAKDLILTNAHCILDDNDQLIATHAQMTMEYLRAGDELNVERYSVDVAAPVELGSARRSGVPDYAILRVLGGKPGLKWGTLKIATEEPGEGRSLAIGHHPQGFPKSLSSGPTCRVSRLGGNDMFHLCDTQGGSSGAPVFVLGADAMVALHYRKAGTRENAAVPVSFLIEHSKILASLAGGAPTTLNPGGISNTEDCSEITKAWDLVKDSKTCSDFDSFARFYAGRKCFPVQLAQSRAENCTKPVIVENPPSRPVLSEETAITVAATYLNAWERRDVAGMARFLSSNFFSQNIGEERKYREDFLAGKRRLFSKVSWIQIGRSNIQINRLGQDTLEVYFDQHYNASNYESRGRAALRIELISGNAMITQERFRRDSFNRK